MAQEGLRDRTPLRHSTTEATLPQASDSPLSGFRAGHRLIIRSEICDVLGRRGMAQVWLARDIELQVDAALQVVRPERFGDTAMLERPPSVRDPASDTGWRIDIGPFPGWAEVPEWQP